MFTLPATPMNNTSEIYRSPQVARSLKTIRHRRPQSPPGPIVRLGVREPPAQHAWRRLYGSRALGSAGQAACWGCHGLLQQQLHRSRHAAAPAASSSRGSGANGEGPSPSAVYNSALREAGGSNSSIDTGSSYLNGSLQGGSSSVGAGHLVGAGEAECCCHNSGIAGPPLSSGPHAVALPTDSSDLQHGSATQQQHHQHQQQPHMAVAAAAAQLNPGSAASQPQRPQQHQQHQQQQTAALVAVPRTGASRAALYFIGSVAAVMVFGVANRVLYKMAITPLKNYVFFMAQLQTFGYCAVYFSVLMARHRSGRVSREMATAVPASYVGLFARIGLVEALSSLLGFLGAANLPGVVLPLLSQTGLFWQVLLARFMLGKRLSSTQVGGVLLVVAGVALAALPAQGAASVLSNVHPGYALLFVFSMLFPALSCIYKERVFREVRQDRGQDLDLFVVNSYGSLAQAVFVFALLPLMITMRGMALADLPDYVTRGFQCLRGLTPACGSDCAGAPLLPLAYVATNLVFNVAALSLIRVAGNVVMSLVMSALVPVTIYAFTMDLPFLPPAPPVGPAFLAGAALLVLGLLAYNAPLWAPPLRKRLQQWLQEQQVGPAGGSGGVVKSVVAG